MPTMFALSPISEEPEVPETPPTKEKAFPLVSVVSVDEGGVDNPIEVSLSPSTPTGKLSADRDSTQEGSPSSVVGIQPRYFSWEEEDSDCDSDASEETENQSPRISRLPQLTANHQQFTVIDRPSEVTGDANLTERPKAPVYKPICKPDLAVRNLAKHFDDSDQSREVSNTAPRAKEALSSWKDEQVNKTIAELESEKKEKENSIRTLTNTCSDISTRLGQSEERSEQLTRDLEECKRNLYASNGRKDQLTLEIIALEKEVEGLQETLEIKQRRIVRMSADIDAKQKDVRELMTRDVKQVPFYSRAFAARKQVGVSLLYMSLLLVPHLYAYQLIGSMGQYIDEIPRYNPLF